MATAQDLLDAVTTELYNRVQNGAFEEYSEGDQRFRAMTLADLRAFRKELMDEVAGGGSFSSLVPLEGADSGSHRRGC